MLKKSQIIIVFSFWMIPMLLFNNSYGDNSKVSCYFTGAKFIELTDKNTPVSQVVAANYVAGLSDMLTSMSLKQTGMEWSLNCMNDADIAAKQKMAIFLKYLKNHPEKWHFLAADLYVDALEDVCQK